MTKTRDPWTRLGRWIRGIVAVAALGVLGVTAYLVLFWGSMGRGSVSHVMKEPLALGVLASLPVPIAALPAVSQWLKGRGVRWILVPSTLAALAMCVGLTYDALVRGFIDEHVPLIVLPTLPCALYVAWYLLLPPRRTQCPAR